MLTINHQSTFSSILDTVLDREIRQQNDCFSHHHNDEDDKNVDYRSLSTQQTTTTTTFDPDSTHSLMIPIKSIKREKERELHFSLFIKLFRLLINDFFSFFFDSIYSTNRDNTM